MRLLNMILQYSLRNKPGNSLRQTMPRNRTSTIRKTLLFCCCWDWLQSLLANTAIIATSLSSLLNFLLSELRMLLKLCCINFNMGWNWSYTTKAVTRLISLQGPKLEIFGSRVFTQIRPVWVGDLGTRPKNSKSLWLGPYIYLFIGKIIFIIKLY